MLRVGSFILLMALAVTASAQSPAINAIQIVELQGTVEVSTAGAKNWTTAQNNLVLHPFDRVHTAADSRVALRWSDQSVVSFGASTELEILPPDSPGAQSGLHLIRGLLSFFHRDQPGRIRIITRGAVAGVEGTEFVLAVNDADATTLSVVDGRVKFGNAQAMLSLTNGEQAVVELGKTPVRTAGFIANNLLQWCFYYPAVLDPDELPLTADETRELADSLAAYRTGDLLAALAKFPAGNSGSDAEKTYHAALLLSVGEAAKAETILSAITDKSGRPQQLGNALRQLIAAVKRQPAAAMTSQPQLASEFLAASYWEQSRAVRETSLKNALRLAQQATTNSPKFGFAWARVAELEFSFGRTQEALAALNRSLVLAPRNAQALALKGFILSAQNKISSGRRRGDESQTKEKLETPHVVSYQELDSALACFDAALAADSALGNAWLGRGLVRIRLGDKSGGREDLLVAAALEPQRAALRSYLGKAYTAAGDHAHAARELALAKKLDPQDPTAWLYSALLNQQNNLINDAIRDLEKSKELNDNRSVYRSQLLLDQDQAVRSANLASVYRDAGMTDVSLREAGRAVNSDYANYSAHLFLAGSYSALRQPGQNNSRYETALQSEYLLANLLAPASAGTVSSIMSQQEQFTPFARNHLGVISSTEYLSRGAWIQTGLQYGTFDNFSYALEAVYQSDPGQRVNNDLEKRTLALKLKWQLTPKDSIFAEVGHYHSDNGDLSQYYDPHVMASPNVRITEKQEPFLNLGYHHEWSPGVHTMLMASRVEDDYSLNGSVPIVQAIRWANYTDDPYELVSVRGGFFMNSAAYHNQLTQYSTELQQIWEQESHTTIIGGRFQYGSWNTTNLELDPSTIGSSFDRPPVQQDLNSTSKRFSVYGYHQWQIAEPLQLIGGLSYDWLAFPENLLSLPVSSRQETVGQLSPKVGLIWTPAPDTTVRFAYTRSLGGQNLDQSQRIEPTQVAGFLQSFRSIIGEPGVAQNGAAQNETFGLSLEQKFSTGTYLGLTGEILNSQVHQTIGAFDGLWDLYDFSVPSGLREDLYYQEESLRFTVNQLLGRDWVLGAQYCLSRAKLDDNYPEVTQNYDHLYHNPSLPFVPHRNLEATLQHLDIYAIYNLPCGFFAKADAQWYDQDNRGYSGAEPGDNFWQFDVFAGWRFWHRAAQVTVGVLNLGDQNYTLNPLNAYSEMARARTFVARFQFSF